MRIRNDYLEFEFNGSHFTYRFYNMRPDSFSGLFYVNSQNVIIRILEDSEVTIPRESGFATLAIKAYKQYLFRQELKRLLNE